MEEKIEPILEKKEFGKNIFQRDIYFRHGEKTDTGELLPEGFKQGEKIGEAMETTEKGPKSYHSEIGRAIDFVKTIQKSTKSLKEYKARKKSELGEILKRCSKEFLAQWSKKAKQDGETAALQWNLDFDKTRPDDKTISPQEMASRVAKIVLTHSKMAEHYYNNSKADLINGSHSPLLEVFLAVTLKEQIENNPINAKGKTLAQKMGGTFKTAEQFEVDTIIDNEGKKILKVIFRGKEYNLSEEKLEEMVNNLEKIEES